METARPARDHDMPACLELLAWALTDARSMRGGPALVGNMTPVEILARWMDAAPADAAVYVGEFQHAVVGLAAATVAVRPHATELSGRIECCYVEKEARGVGVGTALMDSVVAWCSQPPAELSRCSVTNRRGGGGGIFRPSNLARAGTDPAA